MHQFDVDQASNLYVVEVSNRHVQKFRPMKGADPDMFVGKPFRRAWK